MEFPKFDGRAPLTKEAMNKLVGMAMSSARFSTGQDMTMYKGEHGKVVDLTELVGIPTIITADYNQPLVYIYVGLFGGGGNTIWTVSLGAQTGGTFVLSYNGSPAIPLPASVSALDMQHALEVLPGLGVGNIEVMLSDIPGKYIITFVGKLARTRNPEFSNHFTGNFSNLSNPGNASIKLFSTGDFPGDGTNSFAFGILSPIDVSQVLPDFLSGTKKMYAGNTGLPIGTATPKFVDNYYDYLRVSYQDIIFGYGGHKMVNTTMTSDRTIIVLPTGNINGGTFKLGFQDNWTDDLKWDATNTQIKTALEALVGVGKVSVTAANRLSDTYFGYSGSTINAFSIRFIDTESTRNGEWKIDVDGAKLKGDGSFSIASSQEVMGRAISSLPPFATLTLDYVDVFGSSLANAQVLPVGTFRIGLTANGPWTDPILAWASADDVQAALELLPGLAGNVRVTGTVRQYTKPPWYITSNDVLIVARNFNQFGDFAGQSDTLWPWQFAFTRGFDPNFPAWSRLDNIGISGSMTGGTLSWEIVSDMACLPFAVFAPPWVPDWHVDNLPATPPSPGLPFPDSWYGPMPLPVYYGKISVDGEPTSGQITMVINGNTSAFEWAGPETFALFLRNLPTTNVPDPITSSIAGTSLVQTWAPIDPNTPFPPNVLGVLDDFYYGWPWKVYLSEKLHRSHDFAEGLFVDAANIRPSRNIGQNTIRMRVAKGVYRTNVAPFGIELNIDGPWPTGTAVGSSAHSIIKASGESAPFYYCAGNDWDPLVSRKFTPASIVLAEPDSRTINPSPIVLANPNIATLNYGTDPAQNKGIISVPDVNITTDADRVVNPKRFDLYEGHIFGFRGKPDVRLLRVFGLTPYRIGSSSGQYQYYNAYVVQPRGIDKKTSGPMGEQVYALFDPVTGNTLPTRGAGVGIGLIIPGYSTFLHNVVGGPSTHNARAGSKTAQWFPGVHPLFVGDCLTNKFAFGTRATGSASPLDYFVGIDQIPDPTGPPPNAEATIQWGSSSSALPVFGVGLVWRNRVIAYLETEEPGSDPTVVNSINGPLPFFLSATVEAISGFDDMEPLHVSFSFAGSSAPSEDCLSWYTGIVPLLGDTGAYLEIQLRQGFLDFYWNAAPPWYLIVRLYDPTMPLLYTTRFLPLPIAFGKPAWVNSPIGHGLTFTVPVNLDVLFGDGNDFFWPVSVRPQSGVLKISF